MLMRSTVLPFSSILKSILKSLILIYPNLNYYQHSVSTLLTVRVEPFSALSVRNENQSLDVVSPFIIFVFKFFYEIYKELLVHLIARLIWQ